MEENQEDQKMSPLEQEIHDLKQEINELKATIVEYERERRNTTVETTRSDLLRAITAAQSTIAARATNLNNLEERLRQLEDEQRRVMRSQLQSLKTKLRSGSRSTPRSRSSSFSTPNQKQSGNYSGRSSSRGSSSFKSTPKLKSGGSSGPHTPHYQSMTGAAKPEEFKDPEIHRYYMKLKQFQKKKGLLKYHVQYSNEIVVVSRISSNPNHQISIALSTATEVRNMYMLFALCDKETILTKLIEKNFDYKDVPSPEH